VTERAQPTAVDRQTSIEWEALTAPTLARESLALLAKSIPEPIWESDSDWPAMTGSLGGPVRLASLSPTSSPVIAPPVKAVVAPAKRAAKTPPAKAAIAPVEPAAVPAVEAAIAPATTAPDAVPFMQLASIAPNLAVVTPAAKPVVAPAKPANAPATKTIVTPAPVEAAVSPAAEPEVAPPTTLSEPAPVHVASVAPSLQLATPAVKAVAAPTKRAKAPTAKAAVAQPPVQAPAAAEPEVAPATAISEPATMQLASVSSVPVVLPPTEAEGTEIELAPEVVANAQLASGTTVSDAAPVKLASIGPNVPAAAPAKAVVDPAAIPKRNAGPMTEVDEYLWEVYQREPVKKDGAGDFTWKDPAAAKRVGKSMPDYVIGGMDRDFREQLYHAGKAMDGAGLKWSMLSAFRDDYRQQIAAGFKARTGNSLHGGSRATGGYGNGRAADVISADGDHGAVWRWIDRNGAKYGLRRPMPGVDPAHIQAGGAWHDLAIALRDSRTKLANTNAPGKEASAKSKVANGSEKDKKTAE